MALGVNNGIRKDWSFYSRSGPSSRTLCSLLRAALLCRRPPRVPERAYYSIIVCTMSECAGAPPAGLSLGTLSGNVCAVSNNTMSRSTHTTVASITAVSMGRWSNLAIIALSFLFSSAFFLAAYTAYLEGVSTALAELLRNYSYSKSLSESICVAPTARTHSSSKRQ